MIYITQFDPVTRKATGVSADSGFDTFETVIAMMGEPVKQTEAFLIYEGVLFSHVAFYLGERDPCS